MAGLEKKLGAERARMAAVSTDVQAYWLSKTIDFKRYLDLYDIEIEYFYLFSHLKIVSLEGKR